MRLQTLHEHPWRRNPKLLLARYMQRTDRMTQRLSDAADRRRSDLRQRLELALRRLELLNPVQLLYRGFSIVEKDGKTVRRAKELSPGDAVCITFADGKVSAVVADGAKEAQHGA